MADFGSSAVGLIFSLLRSVNDLVNISAISWGELAESLAVEPKVARIHICSKRNIQMRFVRCHELTGDY